MSKLARTFNCSISFFLDHCLIQDLSTKRIIGQGCESGGLYILETEVPKSVACSGVVTPFDLHCRLGHPSLPLLKNLYSQFSSLSSLNCESCQYAELHRVHLCPRVNKRASPLFELVHLDVWGPCPVVSSTGFWYFVTFVDDYSRTTWLYLMKNRSELFSNFHVFYAEIYTQFYVFVQNLISYNAKEYLSKQFQSFMFQNDILHQTSCVDTPSQNGIAERKNRHLLEAAWALLFQMHVPKHFWADAISTTCFLINRMSFFVLNWVTLFQTIFPHKSLFPIESRVFRCTCFVWDVRPHVSKLDRKSLKCIFLGYSRVQKGYKCYCSTLQRYFVSIDVTFFEATPFSLSSPVTSQGEDDDLLAYTIASPTPTPAPILVKPPITQVYSWCQNPLDFSLTSVASSSDSIQNNDFPIAFR